MFFNQTNYKKLHTHVKLTPHATLIFEGIFLDFSQSMYINHSHFISNIALKIKYEKLINTSIDVM